MQKQKNNSKIVILGILLMLVMTISGCSKQKTGTLKGVEFTIQTTNGTEKYLVTPDKEVLDTNTIRIMTNMQSQNDVIYTDVPTQQSQCDADRATITCNNDTYKAECENQTIDTCKSFEAYMTDCNNIKNGWESCIFFPIESYQKYLTDYMTKNNIKGTIIDDNIAYYSVYN